MNKVISYDKILTETEKQTIIDDYVNNFLSIKSLSKKYNIKSKGFLKKLLGDKVRTFSEANKIAHKLHPELFKLSDEAKEKIRKHRLKFMKEHPEKTAWRMGNFSYLEKRFQEFLIKNELDKKYQIIREYSVFPYFIDFAFVDYKLAVEIDGSQHLLEERKKNDDKKDELLKSLGWVIVRIAAKEIQEKPQEQIDKIVKLLENLICINNTETIRFGIVKMPKTYQKAERLENGKTQKQIDSYFKQRKVERPSKEELLKMLLTENFTSIGRIYKVSDNAVRKWCKNYQIPTSFNEIKKYRKIVTTKFLK